MSDRNGEYETAEGSSAQDGNHGKLVGCLSLHTRHTVHETDPLRVRHLNILC